MIRLEGVNKSFGKNHVLKGVDLEVQRGESLVVIGGSGSGKSVLIKHVIGLLKPDKGKVFIDGLDISKLPERKLNEVRTRFGMLFQNSALFDSMSVGNNVAFGLAEHTDMGRGGIRERVAECLRMVGMPGTEDLWPADLSGGMRKRVALARAIAYEPQIILYDEPTTGLDPIMADIINTLINDLNRELEVTSVAITHDLVSARKIADRIAMLYDGKIIQSGSPEEIMSSDNPYVRQFVTGSAKGPIQITH
jgi:phospholipid/cholesterol/gamma-HCH transport system ATP-binding protein